MYFEHVIGLSFLRTVDGFIMNRQEDETLMIGY